LGFLNRIGVPVVAQVTHRRYPAPGKTDRGQGHAGKVPEGEVDAVYLCYTKFINTMKQEPVVEQLLPLPAKKQADEGNHNWDYIYEPDAQP
jgi:F-type H+-transporting ATPase subunit gamma